MLGMVPPVAAGRLSRALAQAVSDMAMACDDKRRSQVAGAAFQAIERAAGHADDVAFMARVKASIEPADDQPIADTLTCATYDDAFAAWEAGIIDDARFDAECKRFEAIQAPAFA